MATYGDAASPASITQYLDALFSTSLANYQKTLIDQIGAANPFLHMLLASDYYQGEDGGTDLRGPLLYEIGSFDSYDGYDELSTVPMDGITQWTDEWRQCAVPIVYSMKETIQNKKKLVDLVDAKITQAEMGIQEGFADAFFNGAGATTLALQRTPKSSTINGSLNVNPIGMLVDYGATTSASIHNINQSTYSWWQNKTKASSATTGDGFLTECINFYNTLSLKTGGSPNLILCDQTSWELLAMSYFQRYRQTSSDANFPFQNLKLYNARVVMEEKVNDVYTPASGCATKGTMFYLNTKFFRVKYINGRNFAMLEDENGKTFVKPINGDSRVGHMAWMGQAICNNRRKQGVFGNIARTLTTSM